MGKTCPVCGGSQLSEFYRVRGLPVQDGLLWPTRDAALRAQTGDVTLEFCDSCGFIVNTAFEPEKVTYAPGYDISLAWSPLYRRFLHALAARLIARHGIHEKVVLEIGCGNAEFLTEICRLGPNRGIGLDPSLGQEVIDRSSPSGITLVRDYYSQRYAETADLIVFRHVLEGLADPMTFLRSIREGLADDAATGIYCEGPDARHIVGDGVTWDVIYESTSYFSRASLGAAFRRSGFEVLDSGPCF